MVLSESFLKGQVRKGNPAVDEHNLETHHTYIGLLQNRDSYAPGIKIDTSLSESDDPRESIWSQQQSLAYVQKMPWGVSGSLAYVYRKEKFGPMLGAPFSGQQYYVPVLALNLKFDLWKNFLGNLDHGRKQYFRTVLSQSKINEKIQNYQFYTGLRSLYWRMVAQARRESVLKGFVASARSALRNMQARQRENVADKGAVAEMAASLAGAEANARRASLVSRFLERELKTQVPFLQGKKFRVDADYQKFREASQEAQTCAAAQTAIAKVPYDNTSYDELIGKMKQAVYWKSKELDSYSSPDVSLSLEGSSFGLDQDSSEALGQPFGLDQSAYTATLGVSIPLGSPARTEKNLLIFEKRTTAVQEAKINAQFKAVHESLQLNYPALTESVRFFQKSIREYEIVVKSTSDKFRQGRRSVFDYISSRNSLLNSRLQMVDLEEQMILEVLNYLSIFNSAPCSFNR